MHNFLEFTKYPEIAQDCALWEGILSTALHWVPCGTQAHLLVHIHEILELENSLRIIQFKVLIFQKRKIQDINIKQYSQGFKTPCLKKDGGRKIIINHQQGYSFICCVQR